MEEPHDILLAIAFHPNTLSGSSSSQSKYVNRNTGKEKGTASVAEEGVPTRREKGKSERRTKKQSWKG